MIGFLKEFFSGEKSREEQAILSSLEQQKKRDVMVVGDYAMDEEEAADCGTPCGGCGCRG